MIESTAAKPPVERAGHSTLLRYLQVKRRADERTLTPDLTSSRSVATCSRRWLELEIRLPKLFALASIYPQVNRLHRRVTVRLSSNCFG
jgi:hypothetical protein